MTAKADEAGRQDVKRQEDCCDKCGTPMRLWDVTPCVRSLTRSPRHSVTRFYLPMPGEADRG